MTNDDENINYINVCYDKKNWTTNDDVVWIVPNYRDLLVDCVENVFSPII